MSTALGDIDKALYQSVISDDGLTTLLGGEKFFDNSPPQGTVAPYIHLGDGTENKENVFNSNGNIGATRIHIWAESRKKANEIYKHLNRILDAQPLTLDDNVLIRGDLVLSTTMRDPDDPKLTHIVAVFSYTTREVTSL